MNKGDIQVEMRGPAESRGGSHPYHPGSSKKTELRLQDMELSIFIAMVVSFRPIKESFHFLHEGIMESIDIVLSD
jgi:hypothetical protein